MEITFNLDELQRLYVQADGASNATPEGQAYGRHVDTYHKLYAVHSRIDEQIKRLEEKRAALHAKIQDAEETSRELHKTWAATPAYKLVATLGELYSAESDRQKADKENAA